MAVSVDGSVKLIHTQHPVAKSIPDNPRSRVLQDVKTQLHRLTVAVDDLKREGTVTTLGAAERVLGAAVTLVDELTEASRGKDKSI